MSPYRKDREGVRSVVESQKGLRFFEVFVDTPLDICKQRDPKGLYRQAREGKISFFTGITDPYEPPQSPDLVLEAGELTPERHAQRVLEYLALEGIFPSGSPRGQGEDS